MNYNIKIKNHLETTDEIKNNEVNYENNYACDIEEDSDKIIITFQKKEEQELEENIYSKLDKIFNRFIIDKKTLEIMNIDELGEKWKVEKKNQIFNSKNKEVISILMELSKYFENKEYLSKLISNYLFMPFILFFIKNIKEKSNKLEIYGVFIEEILQFDVDILKKEDKYILEGKIDPEFDAVDYKKNIRDYFSIQPGKPFSLLIDLKGEIEYDEFIKEFKVEINLKSEKLINYTYSIEILKEDSHE
ncbi:MAG: hypothetical protein ACRC6K_06165 [Fusobacteriaceae bacterium]